MLKQRVLTGLVLAPLTIWAIFALPETGFIVLLLGIFSIAAWELGGLAGLSQPGPRLFYVVGMFALMGATGFYATLQDRILDVLYLLITAFWLLALLGLFYFYQHTVKRSDFSLFRLLAGIGIILGPFVALLVLRHRDPLGPQWVMYLLLLIWVADSCAYFTGRAFGRHKLLYNVSPGKSWEGVVGALLGCLLLAVIAGWWFELVVANYLWFIAISLVVVVFSVAGDLVESLFKRQVGVKDSGHILPGHGGVLDRIDSLTAAAPVFASGLYLLELST
ncbi:phosphatidate cytidylyltransferase [Thiohalophilus thiocyanatoxydans]|uniref:Phosphatidate cytidylyltransferase n=1 Tax=Thiohalophilus thiocyanatoxydans TaxID=381308 RepID=A0A4R8IIK8_9GAMM|nr:phosphatidate cytidylyltransferase [Thiohalophilus thiocyanatoxydans]TDY00118.1 phosphatidate cytidylyltransferase [Thiohalophilus thiocyanatoxydans]